MQLSKVDNFYGPPGTGKSSAALLLMLERLERGELDRIRAVVGDGSLTTYTSSGLMEAGKLEAIYYPVRPEPLTVCNRLTAGYWPENPSDLQSPLRPPAEDLSRTGYIFEGLAVASDYMMGDQKGGMAQRAAIGESLNNEGSIQVKDSDMAFGGPHATHYGFVNRRILTCIANTYGLGGPVIWTTHERESSEMRRNKQDGKFFKAEAVGEKLIGPEVNGSSLTATIGRHFNHTLHFVTCTKRDQVIDTHTAARVTDVRTQYRVYTRNHYDPDGLISTLYLANVRTLRPDLIKDYYICDPIGSGVLELYEILRNSQLTLKESHAR